MGKEGYEGRNGIGGGFERREGREGRGVRESYHTGTYFFQFELWLMIHKLLMIHSEIQ